MEKNKCEYCGEVITKDNEPNFGVKTICRPCQTLYYHVITRRKYSTEAKYILYVSLKEKGREWFTKYRKKLVERIEYHDKIIETAREAAQKEYYQETVKKIENV